MASAHPSTRATIAVAGASTGLGRALIDEFQAHRQYDIVVLTRRRRLELEMEMKIPMVAIDYGDPAMISRILEDRKVDVVISTLNSMTTVEPEINLISAADRASTVKRYIPSIWASFYYRPEHDALPLIKPKFQILEALQHTSLEYMALFVGFFLDYYGSPRVKSYMGTFPICVDVEHNFAAIPGSGNVPVNFTHSFDIARFAIASLELSQWTRENFIVGDQVTWNQFVQFAESVKGVKFNIRHDSLEDLQKGKVTKLPVQEALYASDAGDDVANLYASFGSWSELGFLHSQPPRSLNQAFPGIKPIRVREFLRQAWDGQP